ncbi:hypothetical protein MJT46_018200 [Ovis ammon polii x Ovis aries]|nr:hypothetical protein MJT46_018200 [Ovis ammon polii x Ovis aries]
MRLYPEQSYSLHSLYLLDRISSGERRLLTQLIFSAPVFYKGRSQKLAGASILDLGDVVNQPERTGARGVLDGGKGDPRDLGRRGTSAEMQRDCRYQVWSQERDGNEPVKYLPEKSMPDMKALWTAVTVSSHSDGGSQELRPPQHQYQRTIHDVRLLVPFLKYFLSLSIFEAERQKCTRGPFRDKLQNQNRLLINAFW